MSLERYLTKIQNKEPINVRAFRKLLPQEMSDQFHDYFQTRPVTGSLTLVEPAHADVMCRLLRLALPTTSRVDAAERLSDSHRHGVECAFLIVAHLVDGDSRIDVVRVDHDGARLDFDLRPRALLIENEENFDQCQKMLELISSWEEDSIDLTNTDVILAGGNRINKRVTLDWLNNQYETVWCAFDYDLGGLTMFDTLVNQIPRARFIMPNDFSVYASRFLRSPVRSNRLLKAISLAKEHGFDDLAQTFKQQKRFMEQELLLAKDVNQ